MPKVMTPLVPIEILFSSMPYLGFGRVVAPENNRGTEHVHKSGVKWIGGGAKRQRGRALAAPGEGEREVEVEPAVVGVLIARRILSHSAMARARKKRRLQGGWVAHLRQVGDLGASVRMSTHWNGKSA